MKLFFKYQKLTLLWALFVLVLCNMSLGEVAQSPSFFPGFDKLVHCGFFFVFTTLACNGIIRQRGTLSYWNAFKVLIIAIAFGALIEILQSLIFTWRSGDWNDLFADTVGVCMAMFSVLITVLAIRNEKA
ncbi:VanZ family protein [Mucilaginibacter sp. Bleaf8]|uniref:VanZ family protein n=1 Tax=Mucilaginibacter sp. Bleaf8 TaxID=2834430 RepID=UPI001BCBAE16|nr:VanZ family protein [Mucilaginibacter sp. Bleaf8]MBS7565938.1 VanZ family protein [Mucilaginibacter sp. Bleaf8]